MYIRTKDGVYKVSYLNAYATHKRKGETLLEGYKTAYIKNENIIAQSENLEELCDLFIDEETKTIFHKHNGYVINWKTNMVYSLKALSESYHSVKGAIYTSKGLIYVTKMDDEGELCLL